MRTPRREAGDETLGLVSDRETALRVLAGGARPTAALADHLGVSRSTADRIVHDLAQHRLARRTEAGYELTVLGERLLRERARYTERAGAIVEAKWLLESIPPSADLPTAVLLGATVAEPDERDPYSPLESGMATLAAAERVRSVSTAPLVRYAGLFDHGLAPTEGTAELCLPAAALEALVVERPAWFERALERPEVALLETPEPPPFSVALVERDGRLSVVVGAFDDQGRGTGLVNDRAEAVSWAESLLDDWRDRSTPVATSER